MVQDNEQEREPANLLDDSDPTDTGPIPTPTKKQRAAFESFWRMLVRFSALAGSSDNEQFRLAQLRGKAAILARVSGLLDQEGFDREMKSYMDVISGAMGGVAFQVVREPPKSSH